MIDAETLSHQAREVEQLHRALVRRRDQLVAGIETRQAHRDRVIADATHVDLAADADRIAAAVAEQHRWDRLDEAGIDALDERIEWSTELAAQLRERARHLGGKP